MSNLFEHLDIEFEEINKLGIVEITMVKGERGSSGDYENLSHLPKINGVTVTGNKTSEDYGIDVIEDYNELSNLPKINNVTLTGNKTSNDLSLASQASMQNAELRLTVVENKIATIADPTDEQVAQAVDAWLDEHPEATTTVEDGAVTFPKLASDVADLFINEETTAGDIVSFDDGAKNIPLKDLTLDIEAVQSGSGDPSPTNVRPISGWDEVNVTRTGKNLFEPTFLAPLSGLTLTEKDNGIEVVGTLSANTNRTIINKKMPAGTYTIHGFGSDSVAGSNTYQLSVRIIPESTGISTTYYVQKDSRTVTLTERSDVLIRLYVYTGGNPFNYIFPIQLEEGSVEHAYEPYNGNTYTVNLDGTRYGGTFDVTTGVLTVTHASVDLGSLSWTYNSSYDFFSASGSGMTQNTSANLISDRYVCIIGVSNSNMANVSNGTINHINNVLKVKNTAYTDADVFKTAMSGSTLVYELATPQTVQLTPTEVTTLLGQNNIWCDTGNITNLEYRADTKKYVDGTIVDVPLAMIAPIETGATASKAYAVGEYFILNGNQFCKAKTAIASGATFTLNTNYIVTTIGAELKALQ